MTAWRRGGSMRWVVGMCVSTSPPSIDHIIKSLHYPYPVKWEEKEAISPKQTVTTNGVNDVSPCPKGKWCCGDGEWTLGSELCFSPPSISVSFFSLTTMQREGKRRISSSVVPHLGRLPILPGSGRREGAEHSLPILPFQANDLSSELLRKEEKKACFSFACASFSRHFYISTLSAFTVFDWLHSSININNGKQMKIIDEYWYSILPILLHAWQIFSGRRGIFI